MFENRNKIPAFVRGVMFKSNRALLIKENKDGTELWNFPGGKVEKNETPQYAIVRELHEELGVNCLKVELIVSGEFIFSNELWRGDYFRCTTDSYEFTFESTVSNFGFFDISAIKKFNNGIPEAIIGRLL